MTMKEFVEKSMDFWDGAFDCIDDELPDGAYFQIHVDTAERLMESCAELLHLEKPKGDGHDLFMEYLEQKNGP